MSGNLSIRVTSAPANPFAPDAPENFVYDANNQRQLQRGVVDPAEKLRYEKEFGIKKWFKMGQNEAKTYQAVVEAMKLAQEDAHLYTDNSQVVEASKALTNFFGLKHPERAFVFGGGGSCAGLDKVMAALLDPVSVVRENGVIQLGEDSRPLLQAKSKAAALFERVFAITENAVQTAYGTVFHIKQPFVVEGNMVKCKFDMDAIESTLMKHKPEVLVVETFGNPSTSKLTVAEAKKIIEIAKQSGTTILFDMPYSIYGKQDAVVKYIVKQINATQEHGIIFSASKLGMAAKRVGVVYIARKDLAAQVVKKLGFAQQEASGMIGFVKALQGAVVGKLNPGLTEQERYAADFVKQMKRLGNDAGLLVGKGGNSINIYGIDPVKYPTLSSSGIAEFFKRQGIIVNDLMPSYQINAIRISPSPDGNMKEAMEQVKKALAAIKAERARLIAEGATELAVTEGKTMAKKLFTLAHGSKFAVAASLALVISAGAWLFSSRKDEWSNVA